MPALLGGSAERARDDFDKAIALSHGHSVFAYVAFARVTRDPQERTRLLERAVAMDVNAAPGRRLTNLIAQRYARALLDAARPCATGRPLTLW